MPNDSITILYDHYKETFKIIENTINLREKNFKWGFILIVTSLLLTINPGTWLDLIREIGNAKFNTDLSPIYYMINSLFFIIATLFWSRYFQNVLQIDNLDSYIKRIEKKLTSYNKIEIAREGKSNLKNYSSLRKVIDILYDIFIPILLIVIGVVKIWSVWCLEIGGEPKLSQYIDSVMGLILIIITILYFHGFVIKKKKKK